MSWAASIAVVDNDVYLVGKKGSVVAKYLKNGQPITLTDGSTLVDVTDIVIVKR